MIVEVQQGVIYGKLCITAETSKNTRNYIQRDIGKELPSHSGSGDMEIGSCQGVAGNS